MKSVQGVKKEQTQQEINENLEDFIFNFVGDLMIWGSPGTIRAYRKFQKSGESKDVRILFSLVDNLLREIRKDLGLSNRGLKQYDLYNLFLRGDEDIQNLNKIKSQEFLSNNCR